MRYQRGYVYEASGAFYIRYRVNGEQRSEHICDKDSRKCKSTGSSEVQRLAAEIMARVNREQPKGDRMTVEQFWTANYLPHVEATLRTSTVYGYKQVWNRHLQPKIGGTLLTEFRTRDAWLLVENLAKTHGRRVVAHVKNLGSAIFRRALKLEMITANPWSPVDLSDVKTKTPASTAAYTLEQIEDIISALVDHANCQLLVALTFFAGLRPSEAIALQWGDIDLDAEVIHVRRAYVRGQVADAKTEEAMAPVPIIEPVRTLLRLWHAKCPASQTGWAFPNGNGKPADARELARRIIKPALKARGIAWHGLYAGRRGGATTVTTLTGNALAAAQLLRHRNTSVTMQNYIKHDRRALLGGMKLLESSTGKKA